MARIVRGTNHTQAELEAKGRAYLDQQKAKRAQEAKQWEARKEAERREMAREREAEKAEAERVKRMTPAQQAQHFARPNGLPVETPKLPAGRQIIRDAIRIEDEEAAAAELRRREEASGLPDDRAKWEADRQAILAERNRKLSEIAERCRADEKAAREEADRLLAELGPMPTLEVATT